MTRLRATGARRESIKGAPMGQGLKRAIAATVATRLDDTDRLILRHTPAADAPAHWTSDIAHDCRMSTAFVRRRLDKLSALQFVQRVATGNPTSWRRTETGAAALSAAD